MFVGLGVSGVVPVIHGVSQDGYQQLDQRMGLTWVLLEGGLYIFGAFLYGVSLPLDVRSSGLQLISAADTLAGAPIPRSP